MSKIHSLRAKFTFGIKCVAAVLLVALADRLFFPNEPGSTIGVFAAGWAAMLALAVRPVWRSRAASLALGCAAAMSVVLFDNPGPLAWLLFWAALSSSVLMSRCQVVDALHLLLRLFLHGFLGLGMAVRDLLHLARLPRLDLRNALLSGLGVLVIPAVGGAIFLLLFVQANPVMARILPHLTFPAFDGGRMVFWTLMLVMIWPSLRPSGLALRFALCADRQALVLPGVTLTSIAISLVLFNLLFAAQNLLDIVFLWSGAPLPGDLTMAQYAHRGAYPLIVTALLAGGFVLLTAQPDTAIGRSPWIRRLVVLWIAQNLVLVASCMVRTFNYIGSYMLTELRVAALLWMMLVAAGLILICWRMLAHRSLAWLINGTASAAVLALAFVTVIDLGSVAAAWNVRHAREAGGSGQPLDLAYMRSLGSSAMVPLARLERQPLNRHFRDRVTFVREVIVKNTEQRQQVPYGWIWRDARRLDAVRAILGPKPNVSAPARYGRARDGRINPPPRPWPPLTPKVDR